MRMPGGKVPARGSRVMHAVLYVESNGTTGSEARSDKRQPQGKNARQSHPGKIPLNSGLRAMRLPSCSALLSDSQNSLSHTLWPQDVSNVTR